MNITANAGQFVSNNSVADANNQRDFWMQQEANNNGFCIWCPDNRGHFAQRNNCPSGQEGSWVDVYYPGNLCDFSSTISKQDAENKLSAWLTGSNAQAIANANGTCTNDCTEWVNTGSTYCSGNKLVQNQTRTCSGNVENRTITIENNSCNCVPWTNSGGTYCSGNNLVQNQTRTCSGNVENRTITIEVNSPSCTSTIYYIFYTCDAVLYPWNYYTTTNPGLVAGSQVYPNADPNQISYYVGTATSIDSTFYDIGTFTATGGYYCYLPPPP